jgi:hypothetical protein
MRLTLGKATLLALLLATLAFGFSRHERRVRQERRLAAVTSELAGRRVGVRCPGFLAGLVDVRAEAGRVEFDDQGRPADHTDLAPDTCRMLAHLGSVDFSCLGAGHCAFHEFEAAWAIHTLAHEAQHLRGIGDEAAAECYALQSTAQAAERLGVEPAVARELQAWIYVRGYPNEPDEYRTSACRDGGPLDLRPDSRTFP